VRACAQDQHRGAASQALVRPWPQRPGPQGVGLAAPMEPAASLVDGLLLRTGERSELAPRAEQPEYGAVEIDLPIGTARPVETSHTGTLRRLSLAKR
jgi:hypothetical protein